MTISKKTSAAPYPNRNRFIKDRCCNHEKTDCNNGLLLSE